MNRSYWTSVNEWRDPDCIECGGSGAPCCEPPDHPPGVELEIQAAELSLATARELESAGDVVSGLGHHELAGSLWLIAEEHRVEAFERGVE